MAEIESKQPRFNSKQEAMHAFMSRLAHWSKQALIDCPAWLPDSRARDQWLRSFWKQEPLLSGVISSVVSIDKNRGWEIVGGRNQVAKYTRILRDANNGGGWRQFASQQSESFWTADIGAITEVGRQAQDGPMAALWHTDSARCKLTGNPAYPLMYYPSGGKEQAWERADYLRSVSLPSSDETYHGLGYSALSRAVDLSIIMVAVYRHDREMLQAALQKGILLLQGWDEDDWADAMETNDAQLTAKEREYYAGLTVLFTLEHDMDAKLVALSQLPDNFDIETFTNILMNGYALCFGYDPREFWPVSGGSLGTGRETEVQAAKATSKGNMDFALAFQDNLQRVLPASIHFEFEQRDDAGMLMEAELHAAQADAINVMALSPLPGMETLTVDERRYMLAELGLIPEDWTIEEELHTETDTGGAERQRLLQFDHVRRACERFPDEPIVRYSWPANRTHTIWKTGDAALHKHFTVVKPKTRTQRQIEPVVPTTGGTEEEDDDLGGYALALALLNEQALAGTITPAEYETQLTTLIEQYGVLMYLTAAGIGLEELTPGDLELIQEYIATNKTSIPGLAGDVYDGKYDDDEGGLGLRLSLWVFSLMALGTTARIFTNQEQRYRFELGGTVEHCEDCLRLDGQVHTGSAWYASGLYPQSHSLECGGWLCDCRLVPTNAPESGGF